MSDPMKGVSSEEFLLHLREEFTVIHNSNFFFRDLQYGVMSFLRSRGKKAGFDEADRIARETAGRFVADGIFTKVDDRSWRVNYPRFALPRVEKAPAAKAAAAPPTTAAAASAPSSAPPAAAAPAPPTPAP